jgi:hypothetical protein
MNFGFGLGRMGEIVNPRSSSPMSSAGRGFFIGEFFFMVFFVFIRLYFASIKFIDRD